MDPHAFLQNLALVLGIAALTTVVFQWLRQPVVLGYLLAGLVIGPHVPVPLVADRATVATLSELGVILLMFSLGLEFRILKLVRVGPTVALAAIVEVSLMIWLGFAVARLLGWSAHTSLFTGALVAISSTTIIAKVFEEQKVVGRLREIVFGILIVEDLVAILLLAALTGLASGARVSAGALAATLAQLGAFLVGLLLAGMLVVPRFMRAVVRIGRAETTLVASVGICFALALLARAFGYSVALGAFLAGSLVAESGEEHRIAPLVAPVRDVFAAIFFVAVGMSIDPAVVVRHAGAVVALGAVVIGGKVASVTIGTFFAGHGVRPALQAGMSLAQIGEFSFIIAGLGVTSGAADTFLFPVAVAVSVLTTLTTPWLVRASGALAAAMDRRLPTPIQTFVSLYGSWLDRLRESSAEPTAGARARRLLRLLVLDAAVLGALVVGASLSFPAVARLFEVELGIDPSLARAGVLAATVLFAAPFCLGVVRIARRLGLVLADMALPAGGAGVDRAAAPRRVLVVTLQLASVLLVGAPLMALTQPFLPPFRGAFVLLVLLLVLGIAFWRGATNLVGHVHAGAEAVVEILAAQSARPSGEPSLSEIERLLPGLGTPVAHRLAGASPAVGKTLAALNLRGATGATVLAISRGREALTVPSPDEVLREGDVLALAGSHESVRAAVALLDGKGVN